MVFYTERTLLWLEAFKQFYQRKSMKTTTTRIKHGTKITVLNHVTVEIGDSGIITVFGEELQDWKDNDFDLIKGTLISLKQTPISDSYSTSLPSTSTPCSTSPAQTQEDIFISQSKEIDIGEDSIIFFLGNDTIPNTQTDTDDPIPEPLSQSLIQPTVIPETQPDIKEPLPQNEPQPATVKLSNKSPTQTESTSKPENTGITQELQSENKKLRTRIISLEKRLEEKSVEHSRQIIQLNAKLQDLHYRLEAADKKSEDDIKMAKQLHEQEMRDIATKLECYELNEKWQITTIQGLKADLATQHRKNVALIERFQQMGCHDFNQSLPQSMTPPTVIPKGRPTSKTRTSKTSVTKNTSLPVINTPPNSASKGLPTHDKQGISPTTNKRPSNKAAKVAPKNPPKPTPREFNNGHKQLPTSVHIMYSSNGKKLAGIMNARSKGKSMKVTSSVYSGANIEYATRVIQQGDIGRSTDHKFLGFGTNNVKDDSAQTIIYELKNLAMTAKNQHPTSKITLCGLHHRGDHAKPQEVKQMNIKIDHVNGEMESFAMKKGFHFININRINDSTSQNPNMNILFNDKLHFNHTGRTRLVDAMLSIINSTHNSYADAARIGNPHYTRTGLKL
ncbi:unnamed protein product [Owenia fusiformis]|uniref:Uncharacterized protein n=1 Tax=Owenia fusiformis TaxID=6347 RepID=A0A8J1UP35_OWEFU|nr:unnamed protein product [Owenia fusiformis]